MFLLEILLDCINVDIVLQRNNSRRILRPVIGQQHPLPLLGLIERFR